MRAWKACRLRLEELSRSARLLKSWITRLLSENLLLLLLLLKAGDTSLERVLVPRRGLAPLLAHRKKLNTVVTGVKVRFGRNHSSHHTEYKEFFT